MATLMLESSLSYPNCGADASYAFAADHVDANAWISLAQAMSFPGHEYGNSSGCNHAATWDLNPGAHISLAQAMDIECASEGSGSTRDTADSHIGHKSLAGGIGSAGGTESGCQKSNIAWCGNHISLAQAMQFEDATKSDAGGSAFAVREGCQNPCISLAQAVAFPQSDRHAGSSATGGSSHGSRASSQRSQKGTLAILRHQRHCSEVPQPPLTPATSEADDVAGTGPVRLALAQMLDNHSAASTPRVANSSSEVSDNDVCVRNDGTIALALALNDQLPSSVAHTAQPGGISRWGHQKLPSQPISLHGAVVGAPPGLGPLPLLLAAHIGGDDSGDAKEDFLATPLPFAGGVMEPLEAPKLGQRFVHAI